jgi:ferredoxin--NADP+ reductase
MAHVITQSCVGDGSCVHACPVNCIQPTPDDPAFELAEMLHIDPITCVDCGACVGACPVDAIKPQSRLSLDEQPFVAINAAFHANAGTRPLLAPVRPPLRIRDRGEPLRVAIIGSGPAAMYAADEVLTIPGAQVSVYERLARPYGLVRGGVAPDHRRTRRVSRQLDQIRRRPGLQMHLGVEVGRDISIEQLLRRHHGVVHAAGAATDRKLAVPGAELPGVASATALVGWYNGHPDHADRRFDLTHPRVVVIGNGNVALDVARILTSDPRSLEGTDIAPAALAALRESRVEEVLVVGRRGPEHSAFTLPELVGLTSTADVTVTVDPEDFRDAPAPDAKLDLLRRLPAEAAGRRHIALRYGLTPTQLIGGETVEAVELAPTVGGSQAAVQRIAAGLVVTSIGYRGTPIDGLPFDAATGTVPNQDGRVVDPATQTTMAGLYVAGWIKRGPRGFIGTNKSCSQDTVAALVEDYNAGLLAAPATV